MKVDVVRKNDIDIVIVKSDDVIISNVETALDFATSMSYEYNANRIVLNKEAVIEEFFILSTCLAGDVMQKYVNYGFKLAIVGDYSKYTSKSLKDLIYECNYGKDIFFFATQEEAIEKLLSAK